MLNLTTKKLLTILCVFVSGLIGVNKPERDYNIQGSSINKLFTITGAAANLVFAFNTGMLPEIQVSVIDLLFMLDQIFLCFVSDTNLLCK